MLKELIKRCHPIIDVSNSIGTIGLTIEEIREILDPEEKQMTLFNEENDDGQT